MYRLRVNFPPELAEFVSARPGIQTDTCAPVARRYGRLTASDCQPALGDMSARFQSLATKALRVGA